MVKRANYTIDIYKLSNSTHTYKFDFDDSFFNLFEEPLVKKGKGKISLNLEKTDSFIQLNFEIVGTIELVCDRSLDVFDYNLNLFNKLLLKFGDDWEELSDEIVMMPRNEQSINVAQYIYEFISVAIPMKKLHPRYKVTEDVADEFVYSSTSSSNEEVEQMDPRWKKLKNLN